VDWLDLLREIGFSPLSYTHVVIMYLPNKDKNAKEFDVEPWETAALKLHPSRGSYRRSDDTLAISDEGVMIEQTRMVVSFVAEPDFTEEAVKEMGGFMRRFKREANQDSVALVVDGEMYYL
jgi:hypothetical protein